MKISKYIECAQLHATTTEHDIINMCHKAKEHNYYSVCVNSSYVVLAKQLLKDTDVKICSVVGFPLGAMVTASKVFEAKKAIEDGADEIDMVINLGFLRSKNYVSVLKDIIDVKSAIGPTPLKVTLEISELNKNEVITACEICLDANVNFIKTSSGLSKRGATLTVVKIIKKTVKDFVKINAFGEINDIETAMKYINAGVDRISTSSKFKMNGSTSKL